VARRLDSRHEEGGDACGGDDGYCQVQGEGEAKGVAEQAGQERADQGGGVFGGGIRGTHAADDLLWSQALGQGLLEHQERPAGNAG